MHKNPWNDTHEHQVTLTAFLGTTEVYVLLSASTILGACVPLPAPGGPVRIITWRCCGRDFSIPKDARAPDDWAA